MAELLALAEQHSARIVFSGDTRQIQSVEAGDVCGFSKRNPN